VRGGAGGAGFGWGVKGTINGGFAGGGEAGGWVCARARGAKLLRRSRIAATNCFRGGVNVVGLIVIG